MLMEVDDVAVEVKKSPREVYLFIREFMVRHQGQSPTLREIDGFMRPGREFSATDVRLCLLELEELGLLVLDEGGRARSIRLVGAVYVPPALPEWVSDG